MASLNPDYKRILQGNIMQENLSIDVLEASEAAQTLTTLTTITTNNNLTTVNVLTPNGVNDERQLESYGHLLACPEGVAPQVAVSHNELPPAWRYLKVDLFDNSTPEQLKKGKRKLRLSLSFLSNNGNGYKYLGALLNSRIRDAKRGFDMDAPEEKAHWELLFQTYQELKGMSDMFEDARISKCYSKSEKGKGETIFGLSVVLAQKPTYGEYVCILIDGTECYGIPLSGKGLTDKQRKGNCISSGQLGTNTIRRKTRNEFFGE